MSWLSKFRPKPNIEEPNVARERAVTRLSPMATYDLLPVIEELLGTTWRSFDQLQGSQPDPLAAREFLKNAHVLQGAAEVLAGRFPNT